MKLSKKIHAGSSLLARASLAIVACLALLGGPAEAASPTLTPELEALRAKFEKYQDPYKAMHDGYFSTVGCIDMPDGAMGIHFVNMALVGPEPDPMSPSVLLYIPEDGRLRLVAVEWFVPLATGVKTRPQVYGQPFDGPMEGHSPILPKELTHYDLHLWLFEDNPSGLFYHANPNLKCAGNSPYAILEDIHPASAN